jgi:hypothetical protein
MKRNRVVSYSVIMLTNLLERHGDYRCTWIPPFLKGGRGDFIQRRLPFLSKSPDTDKSPLGPSVRGALFQRGKPRGGYGFGFYQSIVAARK